MDEITAFPQPINRLQLEELNTILGKYKAENARLDSRVETAVNWWRMRNLFEKQKATGPKNNRFRAATPWLQNTIAQKQATTISC